MVGGLMNSSYAFKRLEAWGEEKGIKFTKPDGTMAKAVSHGALLWHLSKPVTGYVIKYHYGSDVCVKADKFDENAIKGREIFLEVDGSQVLEGGWKTISRMVGFLPFSLGSTMPQMSKLIQGEMLEPNVENRAAFEKYFDEDEPMDAFKFKDKIYVCRDEEEPIFITDCRGK